MNEAWGPGRLKRLDAQHYLYYLFGDDGVVRYVGCSVQPQKRLRGHIQDATRERDRSFLYGVQRWIANEIRSGRQIHCCIVRPVDMATRFRSERNEINRLLERGAPLLNLVVRDCPPGWRLRRKLEFRKIPVLPAPKRRKRVRK